jgi:hypothetical protein
VFGRKSKIDIVISEPDLESALSHLNSLPYSGTNKMPTKWGIKQVQEWIVSEIPKKLSCGDSFNFGTGLWCHVVPLGYDFAGYNNKEMRLQIVVSVRSVHTDLDNLIVIKKN